MTYITIIIVAGKTKCKDCKWLVESPRFVCSLFDKKLKCTYMFEPKRCKLCLKHRQIKD